MIKSEDFSDLGGFNEKFFMYAEDVDLCVRMRKKGKRVLYFPKLKVEHQKEEHDSLFAKQLLFQNNLILSAMHRSKFLFFIEFLYSFVRLLFGVIDFNNRIIKYWEFHCLIYSIIKGLRHGIDEFN